MDLSFLNEIFVHPPTLALLINSTMLMSWYAVMIRIYLGALGFELASLHRFIIMAGLMTAINIVQATVILSPNFTQILVIKTALLILFIQATAKGNRWTLLAASLFVVVLMFTSEVIAVTLFNAVGWVDALGPARYFSTTPLYVAIGALFSLTVLAIKDRQAQAEQRDVIYQQQLQFYDNYLQEKEADYQHRRILEHDQKQHFNYLLNAIKNDQSENAVTYLNNLMKDTPFNELEMTNNLAVNSILGARQEVMKRDQITLVPSIAMPERLSIEDIDLCIILGNLLDNAIEAIKLMPSEKRTLELKIRYDDGGGNLFIKVTNPISEKPQSGGLGGFITSKRNQSKHGLGLYSIRRSLKKYNGDLRVKVSNEKFIATALLYGN